MPPVRDRTPRRLIVLSATAMLLLVVSFAGATVPKFKPKTIVTGTSIGGVKIGMTKKQAVKVWGKPDLCSSAGSGATWCQYIAASTAANGNKQPFAGFYLRAGKVIAINLETAENAQVDPKLLKLKTSKNIKLHSTMDAARAAYHLPPPSGGEAGLSRALFKQGKRCTMFYAPEQPYTDIRGISVGLCSSNVDMFIGIT